VLNGDVIQLILSLIQVTSDFCVEKKDDSLLTILALKNSSVVKTEMSGKS
jgi:hypothetical protein